MNVTKFYAKRKVFFRFLKNVVSTGMKNSGLIETATKFWPHTLSPLPQWLNQNYCREKSSLIVEKDNLKHLVLYRKLKSLFLGVRINLQ